MSFKLDDLQAFLEIHKLGSFTKAAKSLGVSQPALSLKVARLEEYLQAAIFIRQSRSLSLTSSGEKLLVHAKQLLQMQEEFLANFDQYQTQLSGVIRIAGFSSIMRSMIIPKLAPFLRDNPKAKIEFSTHEMFELEDILKSNQADFILTDYMPNLSGAQCKQIAEEEYVIIESKKHINDSNIFLDHGPYDNATHSYLKRIGYKEKYDRAFMGDVYSIIDGVALGLGKAVMSKHMIEDDKRFNLIAHKKRYIRPVAMTYFEQSYYSPLHTQVENLLLEL